MKHVFDISIEIETEDDLDEQQLSALWTAVNQTMTLGLMRSRLQLSAGVLSSAEIRDVVINKPVRRTTPSDSQ